jgi:hypothetical protein
VAAFLTIVMRVWRAPALIPVMFVTTLAAWLARQLSASLLGGPEAYLAEVAAGSQLLAGVAVLSLAEPLEVAREARSGLLTLRAARGGGFALVLRWLALTVATLPSVVLAAWAGGALPGDPLGLVLQLAVLAAAGLVLGAWLDRRLLVPALWIVLVLAYLSPWLEQGAPPLAWVVPRLGHLEGLHGAAHALVWCSAALVLARSRLLAVAARG